MKLSDLKRLVEKNRMGPNPPPGYANEPWVVYPGYYLPPDQYGPIWAVPDGVYPNGKPRWKPGAPGVLNYPDEWTIPEPEKPYVTPPSALPPSWPYGAGGSPV